MAFAAVMFDLAGTLVDDWPEADHRENMREMAEVLSVGHDELVKAWISECLVTVRVQLPTIADYVAHVCQVLGVTAAAPQIQKAAELRRAFMKDAFLVPRDDAVDTLVRLREQGLGTGLISNTSVEVPILWRETAFHDLIDSPVFSCVVGVAKPDERIYRKGAESVQLHPRNCVFVGDGGSLELTGARDAGMFPVLIRTPEAHRWPSDHSREDARTWQGPTIRALADIVSLIEEANERSASG